MTKEEQKEQARLLLVKLDAIGSPQKSNAKQRRFLSTELETFFTNTVYYDNWNSRKQFFSKCPTCSTSRRTEQFIRDSNNWVRNKLTKLSTDNRF